MKSKLQFKPFIIKIFIISFGLFLNGIGLSLMYGTELGSSPMGTFSDGLHNLLPISQGNANILANAIFLIVLVFFAREFIGIGTIVCTFTLGLYVNLASFVITPLALQNLSMGYRILISSTGTLLMGIGLGIYVSIDYGLGPLEAIVAIICQRFNLKYRIAKISFDSLLMVAGLLLGGKVGAGTIISTFCTGIIMAPVIEKSRNLFERIVPR